jgi:hypothetical protein
MLTVTLVVLGGLLVTVLALLPAVALGRLLRVIAAPLDRRGDLLAFPDRARRQPTQPTLVGAETPKRTVG